MQEEEGMVKKSRDGENTLVSCSFELAPKERREEWWREARGLRRRKAYSTDQRYLWLRGLGLAFGHTQSGLGP